MTKSKEWRLRLGPLNFGFRLRTLGLDDSTAEASASPGRLPPGREADAREVGRIRLLDSEVSERPQRKDAEVE